MRIALLVASEFAGGAERSALELAGALGRCGVEVTLFIPPRNPLLSLPYAAGLRVRPVALAAPVMPAVSSDFVRFVGAVGRSGGLARALAGYDALIASGDAGMTYALASRFRGRLVYVVRDARAGGVMRRLFYRRADAIAAISRFVQYRLTAAGAPAEKVRLVPNGIDVAFYSRVSASSEARARLELPASVPVVLWLGNLCAWKRPGIFVEAARAHRGRAVFVLAGGAHFAADARFAAQVTAEALAAGVCVLPFTLDARPLYAAASLLVVTSRDEPFGRVVVEGFAAGVPVAAIASGALPELIEDGENGVLATDEKRLLNKIGELLADPALLARLAAAARQSARRYDVSRTAERLLPLLGRLPQASASS